MLHNAAAAAWRTGGRRGGENFVCVCVMAAVAAVVSFFSITIERSESWMLLAVVAVNFLLLYFLSTLLARV